jgi:hypothetical protein
MSAPSPEKDLVVLAADKNAQLAVCGILVRHHSLEIRPVSADYLVHPKHDPGCARSSDAILRPYCMRRAHAIVVMDHEGSGSEAIGRDDLERTIEQTLARNGWGDRAAAVVISPELENWVWSGSTEVDRQLGWVHRSPTLRRWLEEQGLWPTGAAKPPRPKEAMQRVLREVRKPWSSAIHAQLAKHVSLQRCSDPAFRKLVSVLQSWFPEE